MNTGTHKVLVQGYVYGHDDQWSAICLNLDIAAQGRSLEQARNLLFEMISEYLLLAAEMPDDERERMLNRKAPLLTRMGYHMGYLLAILFGNDKSRDRIGFMQHVGGSDLPCAA